MSLNSWVDVSWKLPLVYIFPIKTGFILINCLFSQKMPEKLEYTKLEGETVPYLEKYFISKFRTGYVKCKGTVVPEYYKNFGDKIMELEIRDSDTWVCSFPKSGKIKLNNYFSLNAYIIRAVNSRKFKEYESQSDLF